MDSRVFPLQQEGSGGHSVAGSEKTRMASPQTTPKQCFYLHIHDVRA
jgi:hypothetical protein